VVPDPAVSSKRSGKKQDPLEPELLLDFSDLNLGVQTEQEVEESGGINKTGEDSIML
jgi:hypothetical protein